MSGSHDSVSCAEHPANFACAHFSLLCAGPLEIDPDIWHALLSLLHHAWQSTQAVSTHELATLLAKLARATPHTNIQCLVIDWAQDAASQYLLPPVDPKASSVAAMHGADLTSQQNPQQANMVQDPVLSCPDAYLQILMRMCRASGSKSRHSAMQALLKLIHTGSHFQSHQLVAVADVACYHLTDPSELVCQASIQLLQCLAAPATRCILSSSVQAAQLELPWRRLYALQAQQIAYQPEQLAELLNWLGQAMPLVVSQPTRAVGAAAASDEWLWGLLKSCQAVSTSVNRPL